jgi:uncharacterized protein YwgA
MDRKDWTLLVIDAADGKGLSPVQLQKCLFLLGQKLPTQVEDSFYNFIPHNYGPFDPSIYLDAKLLADEGLVNISQTFGTRYPIYRITSEGVKVARELEAEMPSYVTEYVKRLVIWSQSLSFEQLIKAIYKNYPEFRVNSVFGELSHQY